jgi:opacity protein-like surface antigen
LRELEPDVRVASRWSGAFGARLGNDDNIALRDELELPAGVTAESAMSDVFASIQGPWNGRSGFRFDAGAYLVTYFDADDFDQSEFRGGVFYDWRPNDWHVQLGIHASAGTLGGDAFDRKVGMRARFVRYIGGNGAIDLRYTYDDVSDADSLFVGIAGTRQQVDARYRWYSEDHGVQLRYWLETNDRLDPGVSPDRHRIAIDYRYQPGEGIGYEAGIDIRDSDYDELTTPREEDLVTFWATLTYMFRSNWQVVLEYRGSDNDSTDDTFSYNRSLVTLGAMKLF